jgi:hypothetical protein
MFRGTIRTEEFIRGRRMFRLAFLVAVAFSSLMVPSAVNAQRARPGLPLAIFCWGEQSKAWVVGHLATVKEDGAATYFGPNGRLSASVNAKGIVEPPSDRPVAFDCYGKTLDELRAMGRLVELQRSP